MFLSSVAVVFSLLLIIFFILSVLADMVSRIRGRATGYTRYFFFGDNTFFMIFVVAAALVLLAMGLIALYICLKTAMM